MRVTVAAPAKVNLWLRVGPREASGYHQLSTLFCALDLADTVSLRKQAIDPDSVLQVAAAPPLDEIPELGAADENLAVVAARTFLQRAGVPGTPGIELVKRIPVGGGLGGGSSDAGAVLRALRRLYPRKLTAEELLEIAGHIGSDVPFFVQASPLALGTERGERLTAVSPLPPRPVVLILPPFPIATAEAYRWLDEDRESEVGPASTEPESLEPVAEMGWEDVCGRAANDFEDPVFARHPVLREIRDRLADLGARPAMLAGSGSTVFGVFSDTDAASAAARALRSSHADHRVILTGTRSR